MYSGQQWSKFIGLIALFTVLTGCPQKKVETKVVTSLEGAPGCEGAVLPNLETIESGKYSPLSRPLFVYVNTKALKKPEVAAYVKTLLGEAQDNVEKAGFIKLKEPVLKAQQAKLQAAIADVKIPDQITSGSISVNGSSTVYPFSAVAAELFERVHGSKAHVTIGKKGTGGGFEKFSTGETDISNASRPIKESESEKCKANNVEYIELTVCVDGLTVCVNPANNWCNCLTVAQLKSLWEPSSKIKKWKELNPAWPDENIVLYGPDTDSGTFDYFTEVIVGKSKSSRSDYTQSSEDNTLVTGISKDKYALGYFGYSYYDKKRSKLKAVGIIPETKADQK